MKKINLENYDVTMQLDDGSLKTWTYQVKKSLIFCLFHPSLNLSAKELLEREKVASKIESANKEVILNDKEYKIIKNTFDKIRGFQKNDLELVRRVYHPIRE